MVAPTASIVGSVQVAARVVETMLHKMDVIGYDVKRVKSAFGKCVVAPVAADDLTAMGRTNDAVLYAGSAFCFIEDTDANVVDLIKQLPSSTGRGYGKPLPGIVDGMPIVLRLRPTTFQYGLCHDQ
jgi:methenyltetrahydromethanopterin cyclohydrolase